MHDQRAKKVVSYVLPTVLSQCAFFLFTIVDGVFVGNGVGTDALGAVNLAMPFIMVIGAAFMLTTIGGVTVAAIRIGRGDTDGANQAFMHALGCTFVIAAIFSAVGLIFTRPLALLLGADGTYVDMVCDYLLWYSVFTLPAAISSTLQGFGRNDGAPVFVMASTIVSTALNIFLDWLFVYPLQDGIAGAAIATGISQVAGLVIISVHFIKKRGVLRIRPVGFDAALVGKILKRGLPEMLSQLTTPVTILCMNLIILKYIGDDGVNAYSIIGYIVSFAYAIFMGVSEGMQPLFGRSYGDQNQADLHYFLRAGLGVGFGGSVLVYMLIIALGGLICAMFGANPAATEITVFAIPRYGWAFLFASMNTLLSAYLYSTKRTKESAAVNILRGFILTPLCIVFISTLSGGAAIWYAVGMAEALSFLCAVFVTRRSERGGVRFSED